MSYVDFKEASLIWGRKNFYMPLVILLKASCLIKLSKKNSASITKTRCKSQFVYFLHKILTGSYRLPSGMFCTLAQRYTNWFFCVHFIQVWLRGSTMTLGVPGEKHEVGTYTANDVMTKVWRIGANHSVSYKSSYASLQWTLRDTGLVFKFRPGR